MKFNLRPSPALTALTVLILLAACQKDFSASLEKARRNYEEGNYINTVDTLNVGLLHWKESDGNEMKAEAYQLLGESYHRLRNTDKAIEGYREAVNLSTRTFDSAYKLGLLYLAKNQPEPALDAFQKALRMKTDDPMALLGLGNSYFALRRYKDAQFTFQRVIDVSPGVREALESLALSKSRANAGTKQPVTHSPAPAHYKAPVKKPDRSVIFKRTNKKR